MACLPGCAQPHSTGPYRFSLTAQHWTLGSQPQHQLHRCGRGAVHVFLLPHIRHCSVGPSLTRAQVTVSLANGGPVGI